MLSPLSAGTTFLSGTSRHFCAYLRLLLFQHWDPLCLLAHQPQGGHATFPPSAHTPEEHRLQPPSCTWSAAPGPSPGRQLRSVTRLSLDTEQLPFHAHRTPPLSQPWSFPHLRPVVALTSLSRSSCHHPQSSQCLSHTPQLVSAPPLEVGKLGYDLVGARGYIIFLSCMQFGCLQS